MQKLFASLMLTSAALAASAETIGTVSTTFKLLSPNDKVVVDVFDDPAVEGVACYLSHAKTGGYAGALGIAEDTADAANFADAFETVAAMVLHVEQGKQAALSIDAALRARLITPIILDSSVGQV